MMGKFRILYILLIIMFAASCGIEEPDPQLLEPLHNEFLPLYPNSYWYYENEKGSIDTFYTKEYEIVKAICNGPPSLAQDSFKTTTLYRHPVLPNLTHIYGYTTYQCHSNPYVTDPFGIVLSEEINDIWSVDRKDSRYSSTEQAKTTISKNANEIKVKEFETAIQFGATVNDSIIYMETYQVNIGLIKRIRINTYTQDSLVVLNLIDYKINN